MYPADPVPMVYNDTFISVYDHDEIVLLLQHFFSGKPVKKAYIFGSYARNEAVKDSDIDLLVELDFSSHIGLGFIQMKFDLEELLHRKVDLVSEDGLSKYIKPYVDKDKILIYEGAA